MDLVSGHIWVTFATYHLGATTRGRWRFLVFPVELYLLNVRVLPMMARYHLESSITYLLINDMDSGKSRINIRDHSIGLYFLFRIRETGGPCPERYTWGP